jgi:hypothetical protein
VGRYCFFHGVDEITYAKWNQFEWRTYEEGPDDGVSYIRGSFPEFDKSYKMKFSHPTVPTGEKGYIHVTEQQDNPYSAYKILIHLRKICPEEQEQVFCYPATDSQKEKYRVNDRKDHESNPKKPYGKNLILNTMKTIAHICGFDNWTNFTNHAARTLGITMMCESNLEDEHKCHQSRHANAKRMQPYKRETSELSAQVQDARLDTHLKKTSLPGFLKKPPSLKKPSTQSTKIPAASPSRERDNTPSIKEPAASPNRETPSTKEPVALIKKEPLTIKESAALKIEHTNTTCERTKEIIDLVSSEPTPVKKAP